MSPCEVQVGKGIENTLQSGDQLIRNYYKGSGSIRRKEERKEGRRKEEEGGRERRKEEEGGRGRRKEEEGGKRFDPGLKQGIVLNTLQNNLYEQLPKPPMNAASLQ